jgi:hypothetical protein
MLLMVWMIAPQWAPLSIAADRLQEHRVPVEIKELLLAAGERAHIDGLCGQWRLKVAGLGVAVPSHKPTTPPNAYTKNQRFVDRDLIRGGHYGQRSREPR